MQLFHIRPGNQRKREAIATAIHTECTNHYNIHINYHIFKSKLCNETEFTFQHKFNSNYVTSLVLKQMPTWCQCLVH